MLERKSTSPTLARQVIERFRLENFVSPSLVKFVREVTHRLLDEFRRFTSRSHAYRRDCSRKSTIRHVVKVSQIRVGGLVRHGERLVNVSQTFHHVWMVTALVRRFERFRQLAQSIAAIVDDDGKLVVIQDDEGVACRIGATRSVSLGVSARLGLGDMIRLLAWTISSRGPFRFIGIYMFFRHFFRRVATHEHDRQIEHAETAEDNASKVPHRHDLTDMVEPALPSSLEVQNATPRRVPIGDTEDDDECATTLRSQVEDESEWSFLSHSVDSD